MSVTFIHTADWQLGKPFASVEDPHKRAILQQERFGVLDRITTVAKDRQAAFIVVAGDLFDSTTPTKSTVSAACSAIGRMGVPVLVIPGNHDHGGPGSIWEQPFFLRERAELAPNLEILLAGEPMERFGAVLFPCPLLRRHDAVDTTTWLRNAESWADRFGTAPRVVVAHGSVQDFGTQADDDDGGGETVNRIELSRLPETGYDYIALGDWHAMKQVGPKAWYSGTPELDRFPKVDQQPGAVIVVTASRLGVPEVERVPTAGFRWHQLSVSLPDDASLAELARRMTELLATRAGEDVVRLDLDGTLGIEATTRLDEVLEAWRARVLRLRLTNNITVAPSGEELQALVDRAADPLISRVAADLVRRIAAPGEDGMVAALALRELHAACR